MVIDAIKLISQRLLSDNAIFDFGVIQDSDKDELTGIDDRLRNHFIISIVENPNANDFTFQSVDYTGCGAYNITGQLQLLFVFNKCYHKWKVLEALVTQLGFNDNLTITNAGINASNIYRDLYDFELGADFRIIKILANVTVPIINGKCIEICEETCC